MKQRYFTAVTVISGVV